MPTVFPEVPLLSIPATDWSGYSCIRTVSSFDALTATAFAGDVNAVCWPRRLQGDFADVLRALGPGEGMVALDEAQLLALSLSAEGKLAVHEMISDLQRLQSLGLDPVLNAIYRGYRDGRGGAVAADVYSWHVDSAPVEADTWLCTYHGTCSEGLPREDARLKVNLPEIRATLLQEYGGRDDAGFREYLEDNSYHLHFAAVQAARPWSFGVGNLWRIAAQWPDSPVPACVHRAPDEGGEPRLLLIS